MVTGEILQHFYVCIQAIIIVHCLIFLCFCKPPTDGSEFSVHIISQPILILSVLCSQADVWVHNNFSKENKLTNLHYQYLVLVVKF